MCNNFLYNVLYSFTPPIYEYYFLKCDTKTNTKKEVPNYVGQCNTKMKYKEHKNIHNNCSNSV